MLWTPRDADDTFFKDTSSPILFAKEYGLIYASGLPANTLNLFKVDMFLNYEYIPAPRIMSILSMD